MLSLEVWFAESLTHCCIFTPHPFQLKRHLQKQEITWRKVKWGVQRGSLSRFLESEGESMWEGALLYCHNEASRTHFAILSSYRYCSVLCNTTALTLDLGGKPIHNGQTYFNQHYRKCAYHNTSSIFRKPQQPMNTGNLYNSCNDRNQKISQNVTNHGNTSNPTSHKCTYVLKNTQCTISQKSAKW
jgi:hypothetical protein